MSRNVTQGQTVAASFATPNLFLIALDLTKMQVYSKTDEGDVGQIRPGQKADFQVDAFPKESNEKPLIATADPGKTRR